VFDARHSGRAGAPGGEPHGNSAAISDRDPPADTRAIPTPNRLVLGGDRDHHGHGDRSLSLSLADTTSDRDLTVQVRWLRLLRPELKRRCGRSRRGGGDAGSLRAYRSGGARDCRHAATANEHARDGGRAVDTDPAAGSNSGAD
jgi:hypothetical protein